MYDVWQYGGKRYVESMNLKWILNEQMMEHYVTYHGSLTHPPCTEGVEWFILGRPWLVEKKWVDNFKKVLKPNSRPVLEMVQTEVRYQNGVVWCRSGLPARRCEKPQKRRTLNCTLLWHPCGET